MELHATATATAKRGDRDPGTFGTASASRIAGVYQVLLRRQLEHFFPDAILDSQAHQSAIDLDGGAWYRSNYRFEEEPNGLGLEIEWFRTRYLLTPGSPSPFLPSKRRLIETTVRVLDQRLRTMFDADVANRTEMYHYAVEDFIVNEFLRPVDPFRIPSALEALRVAALSTYENRRVSSGALC